MLTPEQIRESIHHDIPVDYVPPSWDEWFMQMVYLVASKSKDKSTKIGTVLTRNNRIVSVGYNGLPSGVNDNVPSRYERPEKYSWTEHSERNSIFAAAKYGISTDGCTLYSQGIMCADCGRAVIQAGVKQVVVHRPFEQLFHTLSGQWDESCAISEAMFREAGVEVRWVENLIGETAYIRGKVCKL
jgi:dCMP deaminase